MSLKAEKGAFMLISLVVNCNLMQKGNYALGF